MFPNLKLGCLKATYVADTRIVNFRGCKVVENGSFSKSIEKNVVCYNIFYQVSIVLFGKAIV